MHIALDEFSYTLSQLLNRNNRVTRLGTRCTDILYIWFIHLFSQLNYLFFESRGCVFHPWIPLGTEQKLTKFLLNELTQIFLASKHASSKAVTLHHGMRILCSRWDLYFHWCGLYECLQAEPKYFQEAIHVRKYCR